MFAKGFAQATAGDSGGATDRALPRESLPTLGTLPFAKTLTGPRRSRPQIRLLRRRSTPQPPCAVMPHASLDRIQLVRPQRGCQRAAAIRRIEGMEVSKKLMFSLQHGLLQRAQPANVTTPYYLDQRPLSSLARPIRTTPALSASRRPSARRDCDWRNRHSWLARRPCGDL